MYNPLVQVSPESEGVQSGLLLHLCVEGEGVQEAEGRGGRGGEGRGGEGREGRGGK